jgi:hypothetical protein
MKAPPLDLDADLIEPVLDHHWRIRSTELCFSVPRSFEKAASTECTSTRSRYTAAGCATRFKHQRQCACLTTLPPPFAAGRVRP